MGCLDSHVTGLFSDVVRYRDDMHDYQNTAIDFLKRNPFSALFIDLGLGKTVISLTTILDLVSNFELDNVLVIAPLKVAHNTWPDEVRLWSHLTGISTKQIRSKHALTEINKRVEVIRNEHKKNGITDKKEIRRISDEARTEQSRLVVQKDYRDNRACIHIINREQVDWLVEAWGRKFPYKHIFIDESDCIKDHRTGRFKALKKVRPMLERMHQLTATPTAESYKHIFAQIYLLDQGQRFGRSFTAFMDEYFDVNKYTYQEKLKPGAAERITQKISDITLTMKQEDYLSLKGCEFVTDKVTLTPDILELYKNLERESVIQLSTGEEIEAESAAALCQKLLQLGSGSLYETHTTLVDDQVVETRKTHRVHDLKYQKLRELLDQYPEENLLVAYWHKSSLERLLEQFPQAVKMSKKGDEIKAWNAGQIPMLLVHPQSSGHGLNLQKGGRRIIFFDIPWSLGLYLQLVGRLNRQGQQNKVFVHHIVASGTYDEEVVNCLTAKKDLQDLFFDLLKKYKSVA